MKYFSFYHRKSLPSKQTRNLLSSVNFHQRKNNTIQFKTPPRYGLPQYKFALRTNKNVRNGIHESIAKYVKVLLLS